MRGQAYFWTNTRKNRTKYNPIRGIIEDDIARIILHDVIVAKDAVKAEQKLLATSGLKKYLAKLANDREKDWFRRHLRKYIQMYHPDCPFEVGTTNRYTVMTSEAAIIARKRIRPGEPVKFLTGIQVELTEKEEKTLV